MTDDRSHLDEHGHARMVGVGHKPVQLRLARARAEVRMSVPAARSVSDGSLPKGDAAAVARIAGIMAAKRTADLIPLCHPLPIERVTVDVTVAPDDGLVTVETLVETSAKTGVEMEALTAASVAALAVYDMVKGVDRSVEILGIRLIEKTKRDVVPAP
jgi:cyclic pyranopterin monophosphate synthase